MPARLTAPALVVLGASLVAGCADNATLLGPNALTTSSVEKPVTPRMDPACVSLTAQIDQLRKDGIAEKLEKAAAKKYKMKNEDLVKADQLTKANADYQTKCTNVTPHSSGTQASATSPAPTVSPITPTANFAGEPSAAPAAATPVGTPE